MEKEILETFLKRLMNESAQMEVKYRIGAVEEDKILCHRNLIDVSLRYLKFLNGEIKDSNKKVRKEFEAGLAAYNVIFNRGGLRHE